MTNKVRYRVSLIIVLTFLLGIIAPAAVIGSETTELKDISEHWAKDKITQWIQKGFVSGYTDETFRPDKSITRAEFMTLVNRTFGFNQKTEIEFSDTTDKDWYYEEIAKAQTIGYIGLPALFVA